MTEEKSELKITFDRWWKKDYMFEHLSKELIEYDTRE